MAMLDAILTEHPESRYHRFRSCANGIVLASMDNGSGDSYHIAFGEPGAVVHGFHHESDMSPYAQEGEQMWPGLLQGLPSELKELLLRCEVELEPATFCFWRFKGDDDWSRDDIELPEGDDPDGSGELLAIVRGGPATYHELAEYYFEKSLPTESVKAVFDHMRLTPALVQEINPDARWADVRVAAETIGYPAGPLA